MHTFVFFVQKRPHRYLCPYLLKVTIEKTDNYYKFVLITILTFFYIQLSGNLKKVPYICTRKQKTNNTMNKEVLINRVAETGAFNNWKGSILLYFTKKQVKEMKQYGVSEKHTIKETYEILTKK